MRKELEALLKGKKRFKGSYNSNHRWCTWFDKGSGGSFSKEFKGKMLVSSYAELL